MRCVNEGARQAEGGMRETILETKTQTGRMMMMDGPEEAATGAAPTAQTLTGMCEPAMLGLKMADVTPAQCSLVPPQPFSKHHNWMVCTGVFNYPAL